MNKDNVIELLVLTSILGGCGWVLYEALTSNVMSATNIKRESVSFGIRG